jgi:nicotinamide riboside transporter PnuC
MGLTLAALIFSHILCVLVGVLIGSMVNWQPVRENPAAFRLVLVSVFLLAIVAAAILIARGGTS